MAEKKKIVRLADVGELENILKKDLAEEEAKGKDADTLFCEDVAGELTDLESLPTIDPESLRPVSEWELNPHRWLKALPPLFPTDIVEPVATWCPSGSYTHKHDERNKGMFTTDRAKNRAKTFPGIAKAMSEQWG